LRDRRQAAEPREHGAVNDCGCLPEIHTGPHWRHIDALDRARNEAQIRRALDTGNVALLHHGIEAEIARLHEKAARL
jgi:hypothetical protein